MIKRSWLTAHTGCGHEHDLPSVACIRCMMRARCVGTPGKIPSLQGEVRSTQSLATAWVGNSSSPLSPHLQLIWNKYRPGRLPVEVDCHGLGSLGPFFAAVSLLVAGEIDVCWHPLEAYLRTAGDQLLCRGHDLAHQILPCVGRVGSDGRKRGLGAATDNYR